MKLDIVEIAYKLYKASFEMMIKKHIERFSNRIKSNSSNINIEECEKYLQLWKNVQNKSKLLNFSTLLSEEETSEIKEAILSGEMDGILIENSDEEFDEIENSEIQENEMYLN